MWFYFPLFFGGKNPLCCSKAATAAETEEKTAGFLFLLFFLFYMSRKKEGKGKVWMNHKVLVFCMNVAAPGIVNELAEK